MLDIGSRLELFVDDWLIDRMKNVTLRLAQPTPREAVLRFDRPWEGPGSAYVTVMKDGDRYRMYYRGSDPAPDKVRQVACYAESRDGIRWVRPKLGLYKIDGSAENNVIWTGHGNHNFTPFRDANPAAKPSQAYKAVAGGPLVALASADGIHWRRMQAEPVITRGAFDSQNLAFWDARIKRYVCYLRDGRRRVRAIRRCTSKDFITWTKPVWLDFGKTPDEHLYTNAITPYFRAPHIYMGFPKRFLPLRKAVAEHPYRGASDGVFMTSRDGTHRDRRFMEAFIRPNLDRNNWTQRSNMTAWGVVPTGPQEISIYAGEHYYHPTCRLRRYTLRPDGFVSVHADYAGGEFVTKPLVFAGKTLVLNCATSAVGSIRVEIQDAGGKAIPGLGLRSAVELYGNAIEMPVRWRKVADLAEWAGRPVRLRFVMKDADLYALRFQP